MAAMTPAPKTELTLPNVKKALQVRVFETFGLATAGGKHSFGIVRVRDTIKYVTTAVLITDKDRARDKWPHSLTRREKALLVFRFALFDNN